MRTLKPCPFCGSNDVELKKKKILCEWYVRCNTCGVRTENEDRASYARMTWNRRATDTERSDG